MRMSGGSTVLKHSGNLKARLFTLGAGFYDDEGDWRWMGPVGNFHIRSEALPAEIHFELSCGHPAQYGQFPFDLRVLVNEKLARTLTFQANERTQVVGLHLAACETDTHIRLESGESFVPAQRGSSADVRRLSVRLSHLRVEPRGGMLRSQKPGPRFEQVGLKDEALESNCSAIHRDCPLCGGTECASRKLLGLLDSTRAVGPKKYHLILCPSCQLIYLSPLPEKEVFDDLYIGSMQFVDCTHYTGKRAELAMQYYKDRVNELLKRIDARDKALRVLEIGSGLSWVSRAVNTIDSQAVTVAQDITAEAVEICKWVDHYFVGELASRLPDIERFGPYQIISMTHVIEHLPDPIEILRICREVLDENGIVFITAPYRPNGWNEGDPMARWQEWSYNHVPAHLQYFNEQSMKRCAERAGLAVHYFDTTSEDGQVFEAWLGQSANRTLKMSMEKKIANKAWSIWNQCKHWIKRG